MPEKSAMRAKFHSYQGDTYIRVSDLTNYLRAEAIDARRNEKVKSVDPHLMSAKAFEILADSLDNFIR